MKTTAAVAWERGGRWSVEEVELDPPGRQEVLVEVRAAGMCHSDDHVLTGDLPLPLPMVGGHEGAGVVLAVGDDVDDLRPGDHVVFGFVPSCGRCRSCNAGMHTLCDLGAALFTGRQIADGGSRHHARGRDLALMCMLGTFARHTVVHRASCIALDPGVDLRTACLLGCGVVTGWGSSVHAGGVGPGDTTVVVGAGGVGVNAVQAARFAGARHVVAVDPVDFKRDSAMRLGATHAAASLGEARRVVRTLTDGAMADQVIMAMGVGRGELLGDALVLAGKRGTVVIANIHPAGETSATVRLLDVTLSEKRIVGSLFGSGNPRRDIPLLLQLAGEGRFELDALVTKTYALDEVNAGYDALRAGENLRGVIVFD